MGAHGVKVRSMITSSSSSVSSVSEHETTAIDSAIAEDTGIADEEPTTRQSAETGGRGSAKQYTIDE